MARAIVALTVLAGCGRIGFEPTTCTSGGPITAALGTSFDGVLCPGGSVDYAVPLAAGDEIAAELTRDGAGWPRLELHGIDQALRARGSIDDRGATVRGFADRDGLFDVIVSGLAAQAGTPYRLTLSPVANRHVFVSPTGDDAADGSFGRPLQHLDLAAARLAPGDVLVLEDGVYAAAQTGLLDLDCSLGAPNGTADQPIRITALTERHAEIDGSGDRQPLLLVHCAYYELEGLHLENVDLPTTSGGDVVDISQASFITLRRLLARHSNRYVNAHVFSIDNSANVLAEELEAYDFFRAAILVWYSTDVTVRRCFSNSRGETDIPGGYVSVNPTRGDGGLEIFDSPRVIAENNVEEGNDSFGLSAGFDADQPSARLLGNVVRGDSYGLVSSIATGTGDNRDAQVIDHVVIDSDVTGMYVRSNLGFACTRCTAIRSQYGWLVDQISTEPRNASASCTACLAIGNSGDGFAVSNQPGGWAITDSDAFGNGTDYDPAGAPELSSASQLDPQLGGCLVYAPASSPLVGAAHGGDIGAQVVTRYHDGALTDVPLWDPQTGELPCGLVIAGVNDDPATSCLGVHLRLHVGTPDCALPYAPL